MFLGLVPAPMLAGLETPPRPEGWLPVLQLVLTDALVPSVVFLKRHKRCRYQRTVYCLEML